MSESHDNNNAQPATPPLTDTPALPATSSKSSKSSKPNKSNSSSLKTSSILWAFSISLVLAAVLGLLFGQKIGYSRGTANAALQIKQASDGEEVSANNVKALKEKNDALQSQLKTAHQERDISLTNLETLREEMGKIDIINLQLVQSNDFLIQNLAKRGGVSLQVIDSKIAPLPENAYEYRFDIGMVDKSAKPQQLTPKLTLLNDINMVEVPIQPAKYEINGVARIRGRFVMPADFTPKQVKLELASNGQKISEIYDWQFGKPVTDMPYSLAESPESDKRPIAVIEAESAAKQSNQPQKQSN